MNGKFNSLKMLNVTHYYRSKKNRKWYLPFGYAAEDIELNNISLHIYQGEALAIIGEPGASKTLLGRIIAGDIKPDRGKINKSVSTYYGDIKRQTFNTFNSATICKRNSKIIFLRNNITQC